MIGTNVNNDVGTSYLPTLLSFYSPLNSYCWLYFVILQFTYLFNYSIILLVIILTVVEISIINNY